MFCKIRRRETINGFNRLTSFICPGPCAALTIAPRANGQTHATSPLLDNREHPPAKPHVDIMPPRATSISERDPQSEPSCRTGAVHTVIGDCEALAPLQTTRSGWRIGGDSCQDRGTPGSLRNRSRRIMLEPPSGFRCIGRAAARPNRCNKLRAAALQSLDQEHAVHCSR